MRLAFMTFACPEAELPEVLRLASELGYDAVEPRLDQGHAHGLEADLDPAGRREARQRFADAGVDVACLATSLCFLAADGEARRSLLEEARARGELAADLGAPGLRVFGGPVPAGLSLPEAAQLAGENLRAVAESLSGSGMELWLETHDTFSRGVTAAQAVSAAAHPQVGICYDVFHPVRYSEPVATTLRVVGPHVRHVHWHDGVPDHNPPHLCPLGQGNLPLGDILDGLVELGYEGCLSGEWFGTQQGPTPEASLRAFAAATRAMLGRRGLGG